MTALRLNDLRQHSDILRLRSGKLLTVRFVEPREAEALQGYFRSLSVRSRYNRFLGAISELRAADRFRFANLMRAWIEVDIAGQITAGGYGGSGLMGASTGAEEVLARGMSPPHFPIAPGDLRGEWSFGTLAPGVFKAEGFTVEARQVPHKGGRTFGYRVSDGHSAIAYIPDHCPTALGPGPEGWGEYHPGALVLAAGVDVLIHDAFLRPDEVATEAPFGHPAADYAVGLARRAGARRVLLAHHKPDRTDDALDELAARFRGDPRVAVAAEGLVIDL